MYWCTLTNTSMGKYTWTVDQLREAVANSCSFSDTLRKLGLRAAGGNWKTVKRMTEEYGISTEHFDPRKASIFHLQKKSMLVRYTEEQLFCEHSPLLRSTLKTLFKQKVRYECQKCGNEGMHCGEPLVLQIDHINGVHDDNRLENLRWLCPNCHTQTTTYAGRKRTVSFCKTCKRPCLQKTQYCSTACRPVIVRAKSGPKKHIAWTSVEDVTARVLSEGYERVGEAFGCSGNGVKKYLLRNGVTIPRYHTQMQYGMR
jgi:diadenosine tetraphosphatase ApaH/serine/threonine PP2A family protein phosphatase